MLSKGPAIFLTRLGVVQVSPVSGKRLSGRYIEIPLWGRFEGLSQPVASYRDDSTRSRPITEVKHRRAGIVLGWGTAWELPVGHF